MDLRFVKCMAGIVVGTAVCAPVLDWTLGESAGRLFLAVWFFAMGWWLRTALPSPPKDATP